MSLHLYQPDEIQIGLEPPYEIGDSADRPFNTVCSLVDNELSVTDTISQLAAPIDNLIIEGFNTEASDGIHFLEQTFSALIPQIPYDHPGAVKMAEVVVSLMTRPEPQMPIEKRQKEDTASAGGQQGSPVSLSSPWQSMLAPECRYSNVPASHFIKYQSGSGKDDYYPQFENIPRRLAEGSKEAIEAVKNEWTRHNAFLARLVMNPDLSHRSVYLGRAFEAFVPALETASENNHQSSADVPAAAVWLIYAGNVLYEANISAQDMGPLGQKGGMLWQAIGGEGGYSKTRWAFWKSRFKFIVEELDVDEMTKRMSVETVEKMEVIDKNRG